MTLGAPSPSFAFSLRVSLGSCYGQHIGRSRTVPQVTREREGRKARGREGGREREREAGRSERTDGRMDGRTDGRTNKRVARSLARASSRWPRPCDTFAAVTSLVDREIHVATHRPPGPARTRACCRGPGARHRVKSLAVCPRGSTTISLSTLSHPLLEPRLAGPSLRLCLAFAISLFPRLPSLGLALSC